MTDRPELTPAEIAALDQHGYTVAEVDEINRAVQDGEQGSDGPIGRA
ncbi:hypothetical protein [Nocardia asteroides]